MAQSFFTGVNYSCCSVYYYDVLLLMSLFYFQSKVLQTYHQLAFYYSVRKKFLSDNDKRYLKECQSRTVTLHKAELKSISFYKLPYRIVWFQFLPCKLSKILAQSITIKQKRRKQCLCATEMTSFVRPIAFQVTKVDQHCLHINFDNANPLSISFPCSFIM